MSTTELYVVGENYCNQIGETENAWRGAMYIWDDIAKRYFNLKCFPIESDMRMRIWNAHSEHDLSEAEKIVLLSTMDRVLVSQKDLPRLIYAFREYGASHENSSLNAQADIIENTEIESEHKVGWNQTSVNGFHFAPDYDEELDEYIYDDLSSGWDLFAQLDASEDMSE